MEAFANSREIRAPEATGTVVELADGLCQVWTGDVMVAAKRAVSCLIAPEEGDRVLLVGLASAQPYVLAVLERTGGRGVRISTDGDLTLTVPSGQLAVSASEGIHLASPGAVSFAGDRIEASAREGSVFFGSVKLVAGAVDSMLQRLRQSAKRVFRHVEEVDHLRAGQIDYAAEGMTRLHGEHTLVTARELVKADAAQIHFG